MYDDPKFMAGYRAGVQAALFTAESSKVSATWGPKATPQDGVKLGSTSVCSAVRALKEATDDDEYFTGPR
ncbi:MAG: hypothetical protein AB7U75_14530 [Hyphomicrobiaceae bacterium]